MKTLTLIISLIILKENIFGQKENIRYAAFNIISGGITSSAIACFNKPKDQKLGKTFINAFWKGCLGGSLNYAGNKLVQVSANNNTYAYVWPARIVNSLGSSMIRNGATNCKLLQSININVFFGNIEWSKKLQFKIDPYSSISAIILSLRQDMSFNFKNTLVTGSMFFDKKQDTTTLHWYEIYQFGTQGKAFGNTFWKKTCKVYKSTLIGVDSVKFMNTYIVKPKYDIKINLINKQIALHEIIHTFQYSEYSSNFIFINKTIDKLNKNINKYLSINLNFGIIYPLNSLIKGGYGNNTFEKEANYFGYNN